MSELTRVISRELADEWDLHYDAPGQIAVERLDTRRWYSVDRVIFTAPDDGLTYSVKLFKGLTESQEDTDPWNDAKEVTLTRVESYERTVTAWRAVKADAPDADASGTERPEDALRRIAGDLIAARVERDKAYRERAHLVALLAALYPAEMRDAPDTPGWSIVYVTTPTGQMSWHLSYADAADLFEHVPVAAAEWDGHTTMEKYQRLDALTVRMAVAGGIAGIVLAAMHPVTLSPPAQLAAAHTFTTRCDGFHPVGEQCNLPDTGYGPAPELERQ